MKICYTGYSCQKQIKNAEMAGRNVMKCIEAQQLVKLYIEGQLSDKQLERFLDHVEYCPECYEELEIYFSIYETLGNAEKDPKEEIYDFEGKLRLDMKNSRRYLYVRKAYRLFRFVLVILAEFLLICTVITGMELKKKGESEETTIYRVIYGHDGRVTTDDLSESEAQAEQKKTEELQMTEQSEMEKDSKRQMAEQSETEKDSRLQMTEVKEKKEDSNLQKKNSAEDTKKKEDRKK